MSDSDDSDDDDDDEGPAPTDAELLEKVTRTHPPAEQMLCCAAPVYFYFLSFPSTRPYTHVHTFPLSHVHCLVLPPHTLASGRPCHVHPRYVQLHTDADINNTLFSSHSFVVFHRCVKSMP